MIVRTATLQPWYHRAMPRCDAITLVKERCIYSARYTDLDGKDICLCKIHADMADFPVKRITAIRVIVR